MSLDFVVGIIAFDCLMVAFVAATCEIARHIRARRGEVGDDTLAMLAGEDMERLITDEDIDWLESVGVDTEGGNQ